MLDDLSVIRQKDPSDALNIAAGEAQQTLFEPNIVGDSPKSTQFSNIVVTGMGGSALAALLVKTWLEDALSIPLEVCRDYDLPNFVGSSTLVIASSYSGNTEETVSAMNQATSKGAIVAVISSGGTLIDLATKNNLAHVKLSSGLQPRMAVTFNLKALLKLLDFFGITNRDYAGEVSSLAGWLEGEAKGWGAEVTTEHNYAKQLALLAVGKTPVFYGGHLSAPVAYKWKISWNENAKNVAFWNEYPEFNHNEFMGWTSHPIEKPFAIFDLISSHEHRQILKRFGVSNQLLSGKRPRTTQINLKGDSLIAQLLWGSILADFVSIYVAILNGVDPTPVDLIEKLKIALK